LSESGRLTQWLDIRYDACGSWLRPVAWLPMKVLLGPLSKRFSSGQEDCWVLWILGRHSRLAATPYKPLLLVGNGDREESAMYFRCW
jgi:hypothetical protein